jgi:hypothetical protein
MREGGICRKLKRQIWLMYMFYKNECTICKPVEISIRKGLRWKGIRLEMVNQCGI